jgi:hypothetical protein
METFRMNHGHPLTAKGMTDQARDVAKDFRVAIISKNILMLGRMPVLIAALIDQGKEDEVLAIIGDNERDNMVLVFLI